ncbi:MAG: TRAP transporter substrate-binding protein DctP [Candidatus Pelagadaptatus aseana]|uniref:TRAP transporter substrate-binding protein n=1 Tax=Candidatus Pelagadaptatus aseana TaxID=3120508 RepID=UPI0039B32CDD
MTSQTQKNWQPVIILGLLALCVILFWQLVLAKAGQTQTATEQDTQAGSQQTWEWKLVTTWPKNFPGLGSAAVNFAKLMDEMTDGRFQVKVYGAGELVPALGVFDAVSSGSAEAGHGAAYYWKGKIPASVFFTSVPFGMNAQEMNGWLHYGGGLELWRELYAPFNIVPFAGGNTGVQMAGWFNKEINTIDDLKGLKMRIPGLAGQVFNRAGGSSINIPGGELYTSLQTGVIDATEWVGPYNDLAFGFYQVAKYYYVPGWHEPGATLELIINKKAYEALPDDIRAMVDTAARMANQDMLDEYTARNNSALQELIEKHNVQVKSFPKPVWKELETIAHQVYAEESEKDADFKRVYEHYEAFREGARNYHLISEKAYYDLQE